MRIRTQFVVTVLLFGVLLAAISASAIGTNYQVSQAGDQAALARRIAQGAGELSYLANDYVIYRESQQIERWHDRFDAFAADAAALRPGNPEEQVVALNLQNNALRLKGVFGSVVSLVESSSTGQAEPIDPTLLQVAWSRIAVQTQGLMSDASRLSQLLSSRVDRLQRTNSIVVVALITLFSAYFFFNYWLIQRRLLRSIANLQSGTAVVGAGDLDFRIEARSNDEVGDLSHAFNRMTARLRAATEEVRKERRRYQELFDFAPDGYVVTDRGGTIQAANRAMGELLGEPAPRLPGQKLEHFVASVDTPAFHRLLDQLAGTRGDGPVRSELSLESRTSGTVHAAVSATVSISATGEVEGLRWLLRDVTRERQMQAALIHAEKLSMAGRLAGSLAHEINNPLGAAMGCAELAIEAYDDGEDPTQHLRVISTALGRTARIVSRLRDLQRQAPSDRKEPADLNAMLEHVLLLVQKKATSADVEVLWQPVEAAPRPLVLVDSIHQVFLNLVLNAVEAMDGAGGRLTVRILHRRQPPCVGIEFADDGPGIAPNALGALFEPFNTTKPDGSGLGLFISQNIVHQHGGSIDVETAPGQGATFTVWLPL
ncbi:MAG TPA: ATP-binding protein [Anaerolineae bacterium]|nr:ATP-binding protein [Anaerolineae bacterium]